MAEVAGKGGSLTCTELTVGVKSWTLNLVGDALEATDYTDGATGQRTYIAGLKGWTGSCEVNWEATNTIDVGDLITDLRFNIVNTTTYYKGASAIVTGISISSAVEGILTMSVSFQGSGTCVITGA